MITDEQAEDALGSILMSVWRDLTLYTHAEKDSLRKVMRLKLSEAYADGVKATEGRLMPFVKRYEWQREEAMKDLRIEGATNITDPHELKEIYAQFDAALDALIAGLSYEEAIAIAKSKPVKECMQ